MSSPHPPANRLVYCNNLDLYRIEIGKAPDGSMTQQPILVEAGSATCIRALGNPNACNGGPLEVLAA